MANFFKVSTKKSTTGQVISVDVNRLDHQGVGVARYMNKPVFIENTLVNEKVSVRVVEAKGKFFKAQLIEVIEESKHRIVPSCQHVKTCGGCDLQHLFYNEQVRFKKQKVIDLFARNNITQDLPWQAPILSSPLNYRRKARIGVQYNKKGLPIVGFRQKGSNNLVQLKKCTVLVNPIVDIFEPLKKLIESLSLPKSIGHVEVIFTQHITLVIRQLVTLNEHDINVWKKTAEHYQWQIYIDNGTNVYALTDNRVLSYFIESPVAPSDDKHQKIKISFTPKDFIQVNQSVNNKMIAQALHWLSLNKDDNILDLFCGLGNFSLPMSNYAKSVVGVEGTNSMVEKAKQNAQENNIQNVNFYQADLNSEWGNKPWVNNTYNKVLLDPARAGAFEALSQLMVYSINSILYVSCDAATLARDSQLLIKHGYNIEKIAIMDMFAQTKHIETMVLFTKA